MQKKVAIIQDISCMGKCSALVALPVASAAGLETHLLPTAILSAHTGFKNYSIVNLTDFMKKTVADWKKESVTFDGIYSGYMLSVQQSEIVFDFIMNFKKENAFVLVDPVMGDGGKIYSFLNESMRQGILKLISLADIITPNLTETAILLNEKPRLSGYDESYIEKSLKALQNLGCKIPIITGVSFQEDKIGVAFLIGSDVHYHFTKKYEGSFCGTGDTFAGILFSLIMSGIDEKKAIVKALSATEKAVRDCKVSYGVDFEKNLKLDIE